MNSATRDSFKTYMGSPDDIFIIVMVLIAVCIGIYLLKTVLAAYNDVRTDPDFDESDLFTTIIRVLVIFLIFGLFFFH